MLGDKAKVTCATCRNVRSRDKTIRATSMLAHFPAKKRQRVSEKEKPEPREAAAKRKSLNKELEVQTKLPLASKDGLGPATRADAIADNADKKAAAYKCDENLSKPGPRKLALLDLAEQVRAGKLSADLATSLMELELADILNLYREA